MTDPWLANAADAFWERVGGPPKPPRDLVPLVSLHIPVSVVFLASLRVSGVEQWFAHRHVPYQLLCRDRSLCGCIVAARGHGLLFVDADDDKAQQRFTIAHELAHFLIDYDEPRRRALTRLGQSIRPVLDGERAPLVEERVDAVLANVRLGLYVDMMTRTPQGTIDQGCVLRAEERADRLALELLAPAADVLSHLPATLHQPLERVRAAAERLVSIYGLPPAVARTYGAAIAQHTARQSTAQWLGF